MSRPEFPNCVMTPEIISAITRQQEYYDQDPENAERQQQEYENERQYYESMAIEQKIQQSEDMDQIEKDCKPENDIDDLPF